MRCWEPARKDRVKEVILLPVLLIRILAVLMQWTSLKLCRTLLDSTLRETHCNRQSAEKATQGLVQICSKSVQGGLKKSAT